LRLHIKEGDRKVSLFYFHRYIEYNNKLNILDMTNQFEQWFAKMNEDLAQEPTIKDTASEAPAAEVSTEHDDRDAMMHDIDTIMTSLETLAGELKEELENFDTELVNEAGDSIAKKAIDFMVRAPKARKAQRKVNGLKLKIAGLEAASQKAEGDKAKAIDNKVETLKAQAKDLQTLVDDKMKDKGEIVQRAQHSEKIKGQIEVLKTGMGEGNKEDVKAQMQKLNQRLKDEESAIKDLEPSKEEKESAEDQLKKQREAEAKKTTKKEEPKNEEPKNEEPKNEEPKLDPIKAKIKEYEDAIDQLKDKKDKASKDKIGILQAAIKSEKSKLEKAAAKEALVIRASEAGLNELAEEIATKLDWQIAEGTVLRTKYDTIIKKAENDSQLNERLHVSVKDRFRNLL
jgi:chromosome segregation ATPase